MRAYDYIRDIRARIDDDPYGIDPYFTDASLLVFINNARRKISIDLKCWESQKHIDTELYIDTYALPNDYLAAGDLIDTWNQIKFPPTTKISAETTKIFYDNMIQYANLSYINETKKTLTFFVPPVKSVIYPKYQVSAFSRTGKYIDINKLTDVYATGLIDLSASSDIIRGVGATRFLHEFNIGDTLRSAGGQSLVIESITNNYYMTATAAASSSEASATAIIDHYTLNDILGWETVKGYVELEHGSTKEYARISKIVQTAANTYTMYVSSFDILNTYKNSVPGLGTVNVYSTTANVNGVSTYFTTDLSVGDLVTVGSEVRSVASVTNNNFAIVNAAFTANANNQSFTVSNTPTFVDNDNVKFLSYILNYQGYSKDMTYHSEVEQMPIEVAELIPVLASVECWTRKSMPDKAMQSMREYYEKLQTVQDKINSKKADVYNRTAYKYGNGLY